MLFPKKIEQTSTFKGGSIQFFNSLGARRTFMFYAADILYFISHILTHLLSNYSNT